MNYDKKINAWTAEINTDEILPVEEAVKKDIQVFNDFAKNNVVDRDLILVENDDAFEDNDVPNFQTARFLYPMAICPVL